MRESDLQTLFARSYRPEISEVHELKLTKTGRLPFSRLAPHQERALLKAEPTGRIHISKELIINALP